MSLSLVSHIFLTPWINLDYNLNFKIEARSLFIYLFIYSLHRLHWLLSGINHIQQNHIYNTSSSIIRSVMGVTILAQKKNFHNIVKTMICSTYLSLWWKDFIFYFLYFMPCILLGYKTCILILVTNPKMCQKKNNSQRYKQSKHD